MEKIKNHLYNTGNTINREIYEYKKQKENKNNSKAISIDNKDNFSKYSYFVFDNNYEDETLSKTKIENYEKNLFLEAYKRIILQNNKKEKSKNRTLSCKITKRNKYNIKYMHPGKYRQFNYIVNFGKDKINEEKYIAWSCCNKTDKKAKGCQKTYFKKDKNFGFP